MISATHFHAMVVHFPIALLLAGFGFEVLSMVFRQPSFSQTSFYLLVAGTLGSVVSYFAGRSAGAGMEEGDLAAAMDLHARAATIATVLAIATVSMYGYRMRFRLEQGWTKWVSVLLFAATVGAVAQTGYYGGQLVFRHGAGVELGLPDFSK